MAEQNDLVAYVDDLYQKGNEARWMYMAQWLQNFFFFVGNQYVRWVGNGDSGHWEVLPSLEGEIQYTNNKILPAVRMSVGRMVKDNLKQIVIHADNDEESIDAAKAATRFLDYLWRETDGDEVLKEMATWSVLAGIGVCKYSMDYDKGPKTSKGKDGEICITTLSPFEFVTPANARKWKKMPWAMHARMETMEWVEEQWPDAKISTTGTKNSWAMYQAVNLDIMENGAFFGSSTRFDDDTVLVKELWIRPCKKYPKGRVIIIAGDTLVHDKDIPFDPEFWPFNWLPYGDVPFRFWPMSMIETMVDPQKAINKMASTILQNIQFMGNGIILAPQGSVDPDTLVAEPGAVWEYNESMGKPSIATPNPVSPEVFSEKQQLESDIYDLAGIHMLGSGMSGLRAAAAIMLVEQQDETAFMPITQNVEAFVRRDAEIKLFMAQKGFTTARKIKVLGEEGQWEVQEFNASNLSGEEDIDVMTKQDFANDKSTRFNQTLQLIATKDPDDPTKSIINKHTAMQLLDMVGIDGATTEYDLDVNLAKWENEQMLDAKEIAVNDFDDHVVHIKTHNLERKRIDFKKLPKSKQDLFALHVQAHQQMLAQQSQQQTMAKGDEGTQQNAPQAPQQPQMGQPMGSAQQMLPGVQMGTFNGADALQGAMTRTHDLLAKGQV